MIRRPAETKKTSSLAVPARLSMPFMDRPLSRLLVPNVQGCNTVWSYMVTLCRLKQRARESVGYRSEPNPVEPDASAALSII